MDTYINVMLVYMIVKIIVLLLKEVVHMCYE